MRVSSPSDALKSLPPAGFPVSPERWAQWCSPLGRIRLATELTCQWLAEGSSTDMQRSVLTFWDADYPNGLAQLPNPPWMLLVEGSLSISPGRLLAIVGSRNATRSGLRRAREFSQAMAQRGWAITSGLARGIDAAAHLGALDAGGYTVAVLGCGIDTTYPPEHVELRRSIVAGGGAILSELPPGVPPQDRFFPMRNRIIAGLSRGVLVVEAAVRSGSLITARQANEAGRAVMAIPGSIDSPQARGCHQMIRAGATLVETVEDILEELGEKPNPQTSKTLAMQQQAGKLPHAQTSEQSGLLELFGGQPQQFDDLSRISGLSAADLSSQLLDLEIEGALERRPGQWWAPC